MSLTLSAVVILIILKLATELLLDFRNSQSVRRNSANVPEAFKEFINQETYQKSVAYTLAKIRFGMVETVYDTVVLAILLLTGLLPWLWHSLESALGMSIFGQGLVLFFILIILSIPGLPFAWYGQFRLEERFGFNKTSLGLWIMDRVKGIVLSFVLGYPLLLLILWLVGWSPLWWIWAFAGFFVFQILMMILYPMFIMPLFNKFEELPQGELRERLMGLAQRTGFNAKTILVMDGSRRSTHSNAFFTGFGRFRRIVLFDTLIQQLGMRELEAVLAHEIGHYKLGHIPKMIGFAAISMFVSFAILGWLLTNEAFTAAFGFQTQPGQLGPTLLLFFMLSGLVTFWLTPLSNRFSRKHEYEADAFAKQAMEGDPVPLSKALRGLSEKNLSNLTPDPLYSAFHYSHPTLLEREQALFGR